MKTELVYKRVWQLVPDKKGDLIRSGLYTTEPFLIEINTEYSGDEAIIKNALNNLTVIITRTNQDSSTTDFILDGDDTARNDMNSAINASATMGITESSWKLADNTFEVLTLDELKEALAKAIYKKGQILNGLI